MWPLNERLGKLITKRSGNNIWSKVFVPAGSRHQRVPTFKEFPDNRAVTNACSLARNTGGHFCFHQFCYL